MAVVTITPTNTTDEKEDVNKARDEYNKFLIKMYRETGLESYREELFEKNIKLTYLVANRFFSTTHTKEDLASVASIGMLKAIKSFDLERKEIRFITYATRCMHNEVLMALRKEFRDKKIPSQSLEDILATDNDGKPMSLTDVLSDTEADQSDNVQLRIMLEELTRRISTELSEKEKLMFANIVSETPMVQKELAKLVGVSQSYLSRVITNVYLKARKIAREMGMEELNLYTKEYVKPTKVRTR